MSTTTLFSGNHAPSLDSWPALTREWLLRWPRPPDHTLPSHMTRWYSRVAIQGPQQELVDGLKLCFRAALQKFHEVSVCSN